MRQDQAFPENNRFVRIEPSAWRVAVLYILVAASWIWLSDRAVTWLIEDTTWLAAAQTHKGWFFVVVTGILLYFERAHSEKQTRRAQEALHARVQERSEQLADQLERVREETQTILDNAPVQVVIRDVEGRYILVNRHWETYAGMSRDAVMGKTPRDLFAPALAETFMEADREVFVHNSALIREEIVHWQDEDYVYISAKFPLHDDDGNPYAVGTILTDITDRKRAAEQLERIVEERTAELQRANQELLHRETDLAEAQRIAHVGDWRVDLKTQRVEWSDEVVRIFGITRAEFQGTLDDFLSRIHPDDRDFVRRVRAEAIAHRNEMEYEHRILLPDASVRHVYERGYVERDEAGNPARLFGTVQDITASRETEQALRSANETLTTIIESAPIGIVVIDPDARVYLWNPAAEEIFGWSAEEVLGKPVPYVPQDQLEESAKLRRRVLAGESVAGVEVQRVRRDGSPVDISMSVALLPEYRDGVDGVLLIVRDITEQKRAEAEILKLNAELEERVAQRTAHLEREVAEREKAQASVMQLNRMLDRQAKDLAATNKELETFTYSVSHDLKAPIRGIDGYSRLLLEDYYERLDDDGRFFLNSIRTGATQMTQLIDDLLTYSRVERWQLKAKEIDLRQIVDALVAQLNEAKRNAPLSIVVDVPPVPLVVDPEGITLVLRNLIDNAAKFTANAVEPRIEIGAQRKENAFLIWVRDNGVGFDMHYHDRIFEIFQRLHRVEDFPGTGVGLAIVRRAVERMGGRVWAESGLNQGATFFVEIPQ